MSANIDVQQLISDFKEEKLNNEDDIKLKFYSNIVKPILDEFNPTASTEFMSEYRYLKGGRADAVFQNIVFEYKAYKYFDHSRYINEALYGRDESDSGLYEYIINSADLKKSDTEEDLLNKLTNTIGVGFDGNKFIFARFIEITHSKKINTSKSNVKSIFHDLTLNAEFRYKVVDFETGVKNLILLLKQRDKIALNKKNLLSIINPRQRYVKENINKIYETLDAEVNDSKNPNSRVLTLYSEWERVFGVLFGEEHQETEFNAVAPAIKEAYGLDDNTELDIKLYLFSLQTYFNILLKLLINSFMRSLINPSFITETTLTRAEIVDLFEGRNKEQQRYVNNFFEIHYYEWFTFSEKFDIDIINSTLELINIFEMTSYILKPESMQDVLQEVYMELIPSELRHLMGEYFSPDWIVEFCLDTVGFDGDIDKRLVDPTCGSGAFLVQTLKRVIEKEEELNYEDIKKITNNIVGFDINPISAVSARANYIMILFSSIYPNISDTILNPVNIPVYIADSVLAPIVYSEENKKTLIARTHVGDFEIPKFDSYIDSSKFLDALFISINKEENFNVFKGRVENLDIGEFDNNILENLHDKLYALHRAGKDAFWPKLLKNNFAPILIKDKFDFVVGNPPWIGWKSMSKTYREGTGEVWRSYGIFEKDAYDKKTTHDDFGMAVTYVAIDQYLKEHGDMIFLLPASFLKSTKGGEGFRKFDIIRNGQDIPFAVERVDNFSEINLFTIGTTAVKFKKSKKMQYPMENYFVWRYKDNVEASEKNFDAHARWEQVEKMIYYERLQARPVSNNDKQSSWLTLPDLSFASKLLDSKMERVYTGRKGVEPAGAKGIYVLKKPRKVSDGFLEITNDISRQRRRDLLEKGEQTATIEDKYVYPMLGGRNIERWKVKSNEYILVPHTKEHKYGIPEEELIRDAPLTFDWLTYYKEGLLASRIQNGKFFNKDIHPFYRLDNIGEYTYSPYKVLWKEQTGSMSAVVVGSYLESIPNADADLFNGDKMIILDSKILYLSLDNLEEAHYVCGIINSPSVRVVIDGYAVNTNRGTDVLKYLAIPKFDNQICTHNQISKLSYAIHELAKDDNYPEIVEKEKELDNVVHELFNNN